MTKSSIFFSFHLLICSFIFLSSCNGQNHETISKMDETQTPSEQADHDPYFVESESITSMLGPKSIVRNILEDRNGDIWFASWEGIIRYDGNTFTNYTNKDSLRRFHVFNVIEDSKGIIWFGTIGAGVYRYDGKSFTNFTKKDGLASDQLGWIYEANNGEIWFGTYGGISVYDGKSFQNYTMEDGLIDNDINAIIEDDNGLFWIGARGMACTFDGTTFTKLLNNEGKAFHNVRSILKDKKGHIWLGGNDGLWRFDGTAFANYTSEFIGYIFEDKKGNIWTSSAVSGSPSIWKVSQYHETPFPIGEVTPVPIITQENMYFGIHEDRNGNIWFGSLFGACRYDGRNFEFFQEIKNDK